ncbi:MAG: hypothetical protein R8G01_20910 [Ilumatobacteraceae bacterium]|nr:hypothetical protein [Ilumatobacteraceae bacterium]
MTDDLDTPRRDADLADSIFDEPGHAAVSTDVADPADGSVGGADDAPSADAMAWEPAPVPFATRVWERAMRRPLDWAARPWPRDRIVRYLVTFVSLSVTTVIMMKVVHFNPFLPNTDLIFDDTTPTGGDFGAHVWGPAFLRDNLLGSFRLNGWTMDWYSGMPAYRFYMVLPALAILLVNVVLPYGVAMKLVSVLGLITLPAACWAFGRLAGFKHPIPEMFACGGLAFVLDESFSIYGGNLKSTMAGEFSFSIALSLGVLALGLLAAGLRTGKYRVWTSVMIAAACVSHGIVLIFVALAAVIFSLVWVDRTRLWYSVTVGVTSVLLLMWWAGPFLLDHEYMTDMKYGALTNWWEMYFPLTAPLDILITTFALIGFGMCIVRRQLNGAALGVLGLVLVAGVYLAQDSLPVIGLLWNPRLLPFLYLVRYLLMMIGIYEVLSIGWNVVKDRRAKADPTAIESSVFAGIGAVGVLLVLGFMFQELPFDGTTTVDGASRYSWGPITATATNADAQGDGWSRYNFLGYEGRDQYYTEYHGVVTTMDRLGNDPNHGCGRALWENSSDNGNYGTTMALMLLPHWTDGCIGSMEGLFFEASGTTPYHFLATAAMSKQSSNPVRELRYTDNDASVGVGHLQALGVRYAMVRTPEAKAEAASQPELTLTATSGPWEIYEVAGSDIVVPLATQPVVVGERGGDTRERYLELGTSWFQHRDEWQAMPANDGPDSWQRIEVTPDLSRREGEEGQPGRRVDIVVPTSPIEPVPLPAVTVSNVDMGQDSIEFDVDQVGVPVLVRVSYFPNWNATGAEGPFRVGPNMMVVVPQDTHVELHYGRSMVDYLTVLLTLIGVGLCVYWRKVGDVRHDDVVPAGFGQGTSTDAADAPTRPIDDWSLRSSQPDAVWPPAAPHVDDSDVPRGPRDDGAPSAPDDERPSGPTDDVWRSPGP